MRSADTINRRQVLDTLAATVFGPDRAVGVVQIAGADPGALFDVEKSAMVCAIPARQQEFTAGRLAARLAMAQNRSIPMALNRAPVWPEGLSGSITHAGGWALAIVGAAESMVGTDLEMDEDLPTDVWSTVLTEVERAWVTTQKAPGRAARLIFSIKECVYKAQFPRSQQIFGFEVLNVTVRPERAEFEAVYQEDIAPFQTGDAIAGRYSIDGGLILTGVFQ